MVPTLLGGLTPRAFLRRHWQKEPLLIRGALPGFRDPVTPERVVALAMRPEAEARLVLERGGRRPWQVVPGPLTPAVRRGLPASRWTILVHALDAFVPAAALLLEHFDFVPRWRVDDVMVSLAAPLGSVGPHVDSYDVFLLQGRGRRRWRIARRFRDEHRPGLDLRVLRRFHAEHEWVLETGDMLYLPPGVAHHGVALDECLTYSIGFRAPGHADLVAGFLGRVVRGVDRARLYEDPDLAPAREPGRIEGRALARMRDVVAGAAAAMRGPAFARFVGEQLTEPRGERKRRSRRVSPADLGRALRGGASLLRRPGARVAFLRTGPGAVSLFADGREWPLPASLAAAAPLLAGARRVPAAALRACLRRPAFVALVAELVNAGVFRVEAPPPRGAAIRARGGSRPAAGRSRRGRRR
jgi:50S ribosomal protein L16 3-hydroxylase